MSKKIKWSVRANQNRLDILEYWINRNKSAAYSTKLDLLFKENILLIAEIPDLGKPTDYIGVRVKIVRDYLIFYRATNDFLEIIAIRDSRRDPKKFNP